MIIIYTSVINILYIDIFGFAENIFPPRFAFHIILIFKFKHIF